MSGLDMRKLIEATKVDEKLTGSANVKRIDEQILLGNLRKKKNALHKKEERVGWKKAAESVKNKKQILLETINFNAFQQMTEAQQAAVVDWLGTTYDEWIAEDSASHDLVIGVDILLEALGREGHFFTEETVEETELDEMAGRKPWFVEVLDRDPNPASAVDFLFRWKKMTEEFKAAHPALYEEIESEEGVSYFVTEYMDIRQLKQYVETGEYEGY